MAEFTHDGDPRFASFPFSTVPTGKDAEIVELAPAECPNGHRLKGNMQVSQAKAPDDVMRRCWECRTCGATTWGV
ncbi:hypothetical protein [Jatrophihabitans sp.]|uniref:hypothetical protein n=1 Tax=Jatrophihabitans sp. TaxID=1932789 RepID=UPI0030C6FCB8|nr:hypothetical protein [Jatrophihabitans sp.]